MAARLRDRVETEANRLLRERVAHLRRELDRVLDTLAQPLQFPLTPGEWGAAGGDEQLRTLRDCLEAITRGDGQREVLTALLDAAAALYPRAALFIVRDGAFAGWAGLGFLGEGGLVSEAIPRVVLPAGEDHLLARAARTRAFQASGSEGPGERLLSALGRLRPAEACAAPVLARGRPVAVLYGDTGSGPKIGHALALEIAARIAGLAMDRLAQGRRGRSAGDDTGPIARPAGATPPEEAEVRALLADLDGQPRRTGGDDGLPDEERRRHADARRFARLLVSELLLYNEAAVIQGRRNRDLAARLAREIERSRQAYQTRFPARAGAADYFREELVRLLADGNPVLLGNN